MAQGGSDPPKRIRDLKDGDTLREHEQGIAQEEWDFLRKQSENTGKTPEEVALDALKSLTDVVSGKVKGDIARRMWEIIREESKDIRNGGGA